MDSDKRIANVFWYINRKNICKLCKLMIYYKNFGKNIKNLITKRRFNVIHIRKMNIMMMAHTYI